MNKKQTIWFVIVFLVLFVLVRLPGINLPYHQDEWKNVNASRNVTDAGLFFAHPPLQQMIFVASHAVLGDDYMRVLPFVFSVATACMLFVVIKRRFGDRAGLWALGLFAVCFYSVFGSLMPDFDGSALPFFFLVALYAYDRFTEVSKGVFSRVSELSSIKWRWCALLVVSLLAGLLIKLSFIIVIGVFVLEHLWNNRERFGIWNFSFKKEPRRTGETGSRLLGLKKLAGFILTCVGFGALYVLIIFIIEGVYPAFNIQFMLGHANQFSEAGGGRNILQVIVQAMKAVYYISPLVLLLPLWGTMAIFKKTRPFWLYLGVGFVFYFVIFDFSQGALDKYLMFAIVPLCALGGAVLAQIFGQLKVELRELPGLTVAQPKESSFKNQLVRNWPWIVGGIIVMVIVVASNLLPQAVVPLHPKAAWFSRVIHGNWNVLTPLTGGSGPMGFYISFLFIASSYIIGSIIIILGWFKKSLRVGLALMLIIVGIGYNTVFIQEIFYGSLNGNSAAVLRDMLEYLDGHPEISSVITYNDTAAGPLGNRNLYAGRFYAAPQFEETHVDRFAEHVRKGGTSGGYFFVVGIPPLYDGFYSDFFSKCDILFETKDKAITGKIYTCKHQPRLAPTQNNI